VQDQALQAAAKKIGAALREASEAGEQYRQVRDCLRVVDLLVWANRDVAKLCSALKRNPLFTYYILC
jgi:hypothetical protein